jgi:cytochrome c-type protein NapC
MGTVSVAGFLFIAICLVVTVWLRPDLASSTGGRLLVFAALFLVPIASIRVGFQVHLQGSKDTRFCMSCHVMRPYGQSLLVADDSHLPAGHFQNRRVDRDHACFSCHTQYTMFGDLNAKMNGLRHLWVQATGRVPEKLHLYAPYNNRECLHCHVGARRFDELHRDDMTQLVANEISCLECHGNGHDVEALASAEMWTEDLGRALQGGPVE